MIIYGHRGNEINYTENTMDAIKNSKYEGIEIDVRLTKDKVIVLHHDDSYKRIYDFNYKVNELKYNLAKFFCESLTTINNVFNYIKDKNKKLIIDIKEEKEKYIKYIIEEIYLICCDINYNFDDIIFLSWMDDIEKPYSNVNLFYAHDGDYLDFNEIYYFKKVICVNGICLEYTGTEKNLETINNIKKNNLFVNIYTSISINNINNENIDYITI
jgi:glycerophosphoryl diester phosphodiesterase